MLEALLKTLVSLGLVTAGATYLRGWRRLGTSRYAPPRWRLALYVLGLATIAAAVLSPLDDLAAQRFSAVAMAREFSASDRNMSQMFEVTLTPG